MRISGPQPEIIPLHCDRRFKTNIPFSRRPPYICSYWKSSDFSPEAITEHPRVQVLPLVPVWEGPLPHPLGVLNSPQRTCSFGPPLTRQGLLRWEHLLEVTYYMPRYCSSFERHSSKLHSSEHYMAHVRKEL